MAQDDGTRDAAAEPLVSILMPVFNQASYVREAIGSAQGQTYPNIEILIHDDGSTDGTTEIVEQLAARDPRIRVTRAARNQGVASARNRLIERARGSFICWLDGDDIMLPDKVRAQRDFLDANPTIAVVAASIHRINAAGESLPVARRRAEVGGREIFLPGLGTVAMMYRRSALMGAFPLRPLRTGSDIDLVLRVAELGEIVKMPSTLYVRRMHEGQMSRSAGSGHVIAIASNIYRALGLGDIIAGPKIDEAAILRRILRDRHVLWAGVAKKGENGREHRFSLVLVLLHVVRRIGTPGDRLAILALCLRYAPWALVQVVHYWLKRRLQIHSRYR
ncbi:MAG: glycosyltransferase family 2 protein [Alphaproteobacteria bacterium]|nr:glycosyltransferase family 2 protein [Alphaproteobacteria bacterium]